MVTSELRPEVESDLKPCYRVDTSASVPASGLCTGEGQRAGSWLPPVYGVPSAGPVRARQGRGWSPSSL